MTPNPFTRGTSPGRARPPHRGSFKMGHAKHGGRKKGTPNAISPRARNAIAAAAKRIARGTNLNHHYWQQVIDNNPLIIEAAERQGKFTLHGTPRFRSREFSVKSFCKDLSAVARRAIQTDQFVDRDLVQCLTLLAVRDPTEFAKFLALALPQQSYLAARPHAEVVEPREAVNPGEYRRPTIPEWRIGFDPKLNSHTAVPLDPALTPEDAYHEVCGAPYSPAPGWDWKFDTEARRYRAIALRPKTPIPEWTLRSDMTPVPVDPIVTPEQAYHNEYGSPVYPAPGWQWQFNSRIERLIPTILEEPSRHRAPRFAAPKCRWLCRWHPNEGYYSLVREDDDVGKEYDHNLYEYDAERRLFKRYHPPLPPLTATKPRHQIEPEPEPPPRRRFFVRHPDGSYAVTRSDEPLPDEIYEYDAKKNRFVRVPEYGQREACK
jgi:hypothetical protein